MTHPHAEHRQHKVERRRVHQMLKGYAAGGAVHDDEREDKALVKKMVKPGSLKMHGGKVGHRADKRARGGRTSAKKGTNVTVVVAPQGGGAHPMPVPVPAGGAGPPPMPPRPPMMPPGGPPMGAGPMGPPNPIRHAGGRAFARGGGVKSGPAWNEGVRNGTQPHNSPGKNDTKDIGRGKPITYKTGGRIEASSKVEPATKLPGGSGGGEARLVKEKRARRDYAAA